MTKESRKLIFNHMVESSLNSVFAAVADPTRRAILERLSQNPARVTDIARNFSVSLNAVSKHLMVLEDAGLIKREVVGREHKLSLNGEPLQEAADWMMEMRSFWETRLDAFEQHVLKRRRKQQ